MKRFLVTGGSGFIGTNVVQRLIDAGEVVQSVDSSVPRNLAHGALFRHVDLLDRLGMKSVIDEFRPTHVYHLGARTDLSGASANCYLANTKGVENLIDALEEVGSVQRVLFASSRLVCRIGYDPANDSDYCPTTAYGASKVEGERIVRSRRMPWTWAIVRPTSIWGEWFGVPYRNFFDLVQRGRYFHPSRSVVQKSFGYVGNTVFQLESLMEAEHKVMHERMFYLGDYTPIDVLSFACSIASKSGVAAPRSVPRFALEMAAKAGDVLGWLRIKAPLTSFRLQNLMTPMLHDFRDLQRITGELPFSVENGIAKTVRWMKAHA